MKFLILDTLLFILRVIEDKLKLDYRDESELSELQEKLRDEYNK